jgi:hypothetical protein
VAIVNSRCGTMQEKCAKPQAIDIDLRSPRTWSTYQNANRRHKAGGSLTHSCRVIEHSIRCGGSSIAIFSRNEQSLTTNHSPSRSRPWTKWP